MKGFFMSSEEDVVRKIMEPHEASLIEAAYGALEDWKAVKKAVFLHYSRSRANVIWESFINRAISTFDSDTDVSIIQEAQTARFIFSGLVLLRFKLADKNGISRNYPTQLALDYNDPQMEIPGLPKAIRVDFVYILNQDKTEIKRLMIVKRNGDTTSWSYPIEVDSSLVTKLAQKTTTPLAPVEEIVKVRGDEVEENPKESANE
jgi:hypothetical protein